MPDAGPLQTACPRCAHVAEDDLEVVSPDSVQAMRCSSCGQSFYFSVNECSRCGAETVFRWILEPTAAAVTMLACPSCDSPYRDYDFVEIDA